MQNILERSIGAARLDVPTYEEVEHDQSATWQAAVVVVVSALAAGIAAAISLGASALIYTTIFALIGWVIWAALIWAIGTKLLPEPQTEADVGQLLRTMGFAAAPGVFRIFDFIPFIGAIISILVAIWMLVTMVVAVRQALDYESTLRAVGVCVIGWVIQILVIWALTALLLAGSSPGAMGPAGS